MSARGRAGRTTTTTIVVLSRARRVYVYSQLIRPWTCTGDAIALDDKIQVIYSFSHMGCSSVVTNMLIGLFQDRLSKLAAAPFDIAP